MATLGEWDLTGWLGDVNGRDGTGMLLYSPFRFTLETHCGKAGSLSSSSPARLLSWSTYLFLGWVMSSPIRALMLLHWVVAMGAS